MWLDVVLDDLDRGDYIRITDSDGLICEGKFCGFRPKCYEIAIQFPVAAAPGTVGEDMIFTGFIETRDIRRIERLACEGV